MAMPSAEQMLVDALIKLLTSEDKRTCLFIGEAVKNGKRMELARKRASMADAPLTTINVLTDSFKAVVLLPDFTDPDEVVIRILRPVKE